MKARINGLNKQISEIHVKARKWANSQREWHLFISFGSLKLKLITMTVVIVVCSIGVLNLFMTSLMERSISEKAYEVGQVAIERIADASFNAIIERTYDNRLNLNEMLRETKEARMKGILDISIYAYERQGDRELFGYFAGFERDGVPLDDDELIKRLIASERAVVFHEMATYTDAQGKNRDAIRFVKPVFFQVGDRSHVMGVAVLHYDQQAITDPIRNALRISSLITLVVLLFSVAITWMLSIRLSRPILDVAQAARTVASGDLNVKLNIHAADEIGALADEFNKMVKGLRERERMQKFVSGSTLDLIRDEDREMALGGGYRTQTFLFSDIRGFTTMSENRRPEEVVSIINYYLNLQTEIIRRHGGDIDKFVGDEIMATFEGDTDLQRAVEAALEIQRCMTVENSRRRQEQEVTVQVGIGIHRGEVLVGNMGSHDRMDFTSIGAAVNLAARLCSQAQPGEVLLTSEFYHALGMELGGQTHEPIAVKGLSQLVEIVSIKEFT